MSTQRRILLTATGINQKVNNYTNAGDYEFGLVFSPTVNGKINAITVKLPDVNANLRVTIWDAKATTVLRTEIVSVTSSNTMITKSISALTLEKDKSMQLLRTAIIGTIEKGQTVRTLPIQ